MPSSLFPPVYQAVFDAENVKLHDHEHGAQRDPLWSIERTNKTNSSGTPILS